MAKVQSNDNIFKQLRRGWDRLNTAENRMVKTAYLDNPNQIYDDFLFPTRIILAVAIGVTLAFGGYYHYHIFSSAFGIGAVAIIGSLLWFVVIEIAKVYLGIRVARSFSSGAWMQSWNKFTFTIILLGIVFYAFVLSIRISTKSVSTVNEMVQSSRLHKENIFIPPPSLSLIDEQIKAAEAVSLKAQKSTWKGRPTSEGLAMMQKAETTKQALLKQRETILAQARQDYEKTLSISQKEISTSAIQLATYGGIAEYVTAILIILLALLERISYEQNITNSPSTQPERSVPENPYTSGRSPSIAFGDERKKIGFQLPETKPETPETNHPETSETTPETKHLKQPETLVATAFQRVSEPETKHLKQPETKVILHTEIRDDIERAVAEQIRNIQRYFAKWRNRGKGGGRPETIIANIQQSFETIKQLQQEGEITANLKQKVAEYFQLFKQIQC